MVVVVGWTEGEGMVVGGEGGWGGVDKMRERGRRILSPDQGILPFAAEASVLITRSAFFGMCGI